MLFRSDLDGMSGAIEAAFSEKERPVLVIVRTTIAYGSPGKQGSASSHGSPLGEDEIAKTKENLGWPSSPPFLVPEDVLAHCREAVGRGERWEKEWLERFAAYKAAFPDLALEWERCMKGDLPEGWADAIPKFPAEGGLATRSASGIVLNAVAAKVPELIGGSADLGSSNESIIKNSGAFLPEAPPGGRNIYFGVREHGMGAVLNGMSRYGGVIPYGATFFIFTDYMRPSIRLAALMNCQVIYIMTHDSIGVGEDGPTHQPVEHLASLRVMPNVHVDRPADANETAVAWRMALERKNGPTLLVLTRQKIPILPPEPALKENGACRGGYIIEEAEGGTPDLLLLATGSEVSVALSARKLLAADGVRARVVSMPCWERFEEQEASYKEYVLPSSVTARVSVEAAATFGWERYVGPHGAKVGIDRFGASAPAERVFSELGITPENARDQAKKVLAASNGGISK